MNKTLVAIVIFAILAVCGIVGYLALNSKSVPYSINANNTGTLSDRATVTACDVLSKPIAEETLGTGVKDISTAPVISEDASMSISICSYINSTGVTSKSVSLLVRNAKDDKGTSANTDKFNSEKPSSAQAINNVGDKAYYVPSLQQLNILKGGNWYVLSLHSFTEKNFASVDNEKALATKLKLQ